MNNVINLCGYLEQPVVVKKSRMKSVTEVLDTYYCHKLDSKLFRYALGFASGLGFCVFMLASGAETTANALWCVLIACGLPVSVCVATLLVDIALFVLYILSEAYIGLYAPKTKRRKRR